MWVVATGSPGHTADTAESTSIMAATISSARSAPAGVSVTLCYRNSVLPGNAVRRDLNLRRLRWTGAILWGTNTPSAHDLKQ